MALRIFVACDFICPLIMERKLLCFWGSCMLIQQNYTYNKKKHQHALATEAVPLQELA